jgi:hypothetical protein
MQISYLKDYSQLPYGTEFSLIVDGCLDVVLINGKTDISHLSYLPVELEELAEESGFDTFAEMQKTVPAQIEDEEQLVEYLESL